jgi:hypothetical protein
MRWRQVIRCVGAGGRTDGLRRMTQYVVIHMGQSEAILKRNEVIENFNCLDAVIENFNIAIDEQTEAVNRRYNNL